MKIDTLNNNGVINMQENHHHNYLEKRFPRKDRWDWDEMHKPVDNDEPKPIHLRTGAGRKLDFLRVLVALHEAGYFTDEVGGQVDRKDVFAAFGGILGIDLDRANANLSEGLNHNNQDMRAEVFDLLKKAYVEYENELLGRRKER